MEYEAIVSHGFLLQIDAPDLAMERHISYQDRPLGDFLGFVERVVATINAALVNIPRDIGAAARLLGQLRGPARLRRGAARDPADHPPGQGRRLRAAVRQSAPCARIPLLKDLPLDDDQVIVAGVIDPLTNFVEHPEVVADRIERVARAVGDPRRVLAGTDCGFDTSAGRGRVAEDVVWAKLAALAEGARIASKRLF